MQKQKMILENSSYLPSRNGEDRYVNDINPNREVDKEIGALGHMCEYVYTIVEDKEGEWNREGLSNREGYAVIHNGIYHDVYKMM